MSFAPYFWMRLVAACILLLGCDRSDEDSLQNGARDGRVGSLSGIVIDTHYVEQRTTDVLVDTIWVYAVPGADPSDSQYAFALPLVRISGDSSTSDRITRTIIDVFLETAFDSIDADVPWEAAVCNLRGPDEPGMMFARIEDVYVDKNWFSVQMWYESWAAYLASWSKHYVFDRWSGKRIRLTDLIEQSTSSELPGFVRREHRRAIRSVLDSLRAAAGPQLVGEDSLRVSTQIELYTDCIESLQSESGALPTGWFSEFEILDFRIDLDTIVVRVGSCFPHAYRALDELGTPEIGFSIHDPIVELTPWAAERFGVR